MSASMELISSLGIIMMVSVIQIEHPLVLTLILSLLCLIACFCLYGFVNVWLFYSLLLIFLGGLMVLIMFINVTSSEGKILILRIDSAKLIIIAGMVLVASGFSVPYKNSYMLGNETEGGLYFTYLYIAPLLFMCGYMVFTLFTCMKLIEGFKGTLAKSYTS